MCLVLSVVWNIEELVHTLFFWIEVGSSVFSLDCCSEYRGASAHFCSLGQR